MDLQLFISVLNTLPDAFILLDMQRAIICWNEAACTILGMSSEQLVNAPFPLAFEPNERRELSLESEHGRLEIELTAVPFEAESESRWLVMLRDITTIKRLQQVEQQQRMFADTLHEITQQLGRLIDVDTTLRLVLELMARVLPYDAATLLLIDGEEARIAAEHGFSQRGSSVIGQRFRLDDENPSASMARTGKPVIIADAQQEPGWVRMPETTWVHSYLGAPVFAAGELIGFLSLDSATPNLYNAEHARQLTAFAEQIGFGLRSLRVFEQYTDDIIHFEVLVQHRIEAERAKHAQVEETLRAALAQERAINAMKSRFISFVSHDFRTPLTAIMLSTDMLRTYSSQMSPQRVEERLISIQEQIGALNAMIDEILFASRAEHVGLAFKPGVVDLTALCRDLIASAQASAKAKHELVLIAPPRLTHPHIDEHLLRRALNNLLANAIKYSVKASVIHLTLTSEPGRVRISIRDQGIGIPPDEVAHIFDSFYRASNAEGFPGTGLGLSIVHQVVDLHGGTIQVDSQVGAYTTFTIELPLNPA